jgi:hypothetical protein
MTQRSGVKKSSQFDVRKMTNTPPRPMNYVTKVNTVTIIFSV